MNKKVLIIDNNTDFLDTRAEGLDTQGYRVYKAFSLQQARHLLESTWVHVVIVDIRMQDDDDDKDTSGLDFAKQEAYRPIPKIVLTRYPSYEHVREALGPALEGLPPAVAFIAKQEGQWAMLRAIEQAFDRHVRINSTLTIDWEQDLSFLHLVKLIEPEAEGAPLIDRAGELEDLFRKLFYDDTQITIGRLLIHGERRVFLEVFAYGKEGVEEQFILSCGHQSAIATEDDRYESFVPKGVGTGSTSRVRSAETLHFAATIYTLIGGDLEETMPLGEYYRSRPAEVVVAALDQLFNTTLASWYRKGRYREEHKSISELYLEWLDLSDESPSQEDLEQQVALICRETFSAGLAQLGYSPHRLALQLRDGSSAPYPNPVAGLYTQRIAASAPALCGVTHGRVDADTVLVDGRGQTWLVDFRHAGRGPLLRDFVLLEMTIKLDLIETTDLLARQMLEQQLLDAAALDAPIAGEGLTPELQQALRVIMCIRHLASVLVGNDMRAYLAGLLFCAVKRVAMYDPDIHYTRRRLVPYAHSLLLAAMIHEKLIGPAPPQDQIPEQALNSLWIDEANKAVWVEGRQIDLTPQEFKILAYLYQHAGQLCTRQAITEGALGDDYDISEESRFNSALSRLRQKIQPNSKNRKYIITKRGHGYRLELPK